MPGRIASPAPPECSDGERQEIIIAGSFYDIGIWIEDTADQKCMLQPRDAVLTSKVPRNSSLPRSFKLSHSARKVQALWCL